MLISLNFDNQKADMMTGGAERAARFFHGAAGEGFARLAEALADADGAKVTGVAVVSQSAGASWSTIRSAVSMANALAFAWHVPAVMIDAASGSDADILVSAAQAALRDAPNDVRVSALYDGEPNITRPKGQ